MRILVFISMILFLNSCNFNKSDAENVKQQFYQNRDNFELLLSKVEQIECYKENRIYDNRELTTEIKELAESLETEIDYFQYSSCGNKREVIFELLWSGQVHIFLQKENCKNNNSKKGYFSKSNLIETYGLGNGWIMWIDYDFI